MKSALVVMSVAIALTACSETDASSEAPELTEEYGCGFGFYVGDADQTTGLFVFYEDMSGAMAGDVVETADLPSESWRAVLDEGSDLFANWCDDVLEPDEPTPEVVETWEVSGSIEVLSLPEAGQCGPATARFTDLVATDSQGATMSLGDLEVTNEAWGCLAG
jgi:hypothetical protein